MLSTFAPTVTQVTPLAAQAMAPLLARRLRRWPSRSFSTKGDVDISKYPPKGFNTVFNVVPQGFVMMQERLGQLKAVRGPGWFFAIPFVDKIANIVDMREITIPILPQWGTTKDNVIVSAGGALYVRVEDPEKFCYSIRRPLVAMQTLAISSMRSAIGSVELDTLFHDRVALNQRIMEAMSGEKVDKWGLVCSRYELTDVRSDDAVQKAMDLQSVAERDRRKVVLNAEADKTAMVRKSEGQRMYYVNVAEGKKRQAVLEAEADKESIELRAMAEKQATLLRAEADREAIAMVAEALKTEEGKRAQDFVLGRSYLESLVQVLPNSKLNTVFMPSNLGDLPQLVGSAKGILDGVSSPLKKE